MKVQAFKYQKTFFLLDHENTAQSLFEKKKKRQRQQKSAPKFASSLSFNIYGQKQPQENQEKQYSSMEELTVQLFRTCCAIFYHLFNLKNVKKHYSKSSIQNLVKHL